jgi:hypothetical protein
VNIDAQDGASYTGWNHRFHKDKAYLKDELNAKISTKSLFVLSRSAAQVQLNLL